VSGTVIERDHPADKRPASRLRQQPAGWVFATTSCGVASRPEDACLRVRGCLRPGVVARRTSPASPPCAYTLLRLFPTHYLWQDRQGSSPRSIRDPVDKSSETTLHRCPGIESATRLFQVWLVANERPRIDEKMRHICTHPTGGASDTLLRPRRLVKRSR
jgi:hypothetical protein